MLLVQELEMRRGNSLVIVFFLLMSMATLRWWLRRSTQSSGSKICSVFSTRLSCCHVAHKLSLHTLEY
ncbi:unnamed protein product [Heligmosomoides polygyrus]|uniref:Uncharacterized protein n=1 Tax=Heligmosomoides polygyrus TaxID=6339 RepID=A0A3P7U144_HELPZ|nr:unnamed protein product [Heligmosomoides polygyrus]